MYCSVTKLSNKPVRRAPQRHAAPAAAVCLALAVAAGVRPARAQTPPVGMTQDQFDKAIANRDDGLRKALKSFGFKDKGLQDAVVGFANFRFAERLPLEIQSANLLAAMSYRKSSGDEISRQLASFRALVAGLRAQRATPDARTRLAQELDDLDRKTSYTKTPRLEAFLVMEGLLGDDWELAGSPPAAGAPGLGSAASDAGTSAFDPGPNYPGTD